MLVVSDASPINSCRPAQTYGYVSSIRGTPVYRFSRDWTALRILDNSRVAQDNRMMMMNVSINWSQGIMIVYSIVSLKAAFVILRWGNHKKYFLSIGFQSSRATATIPYRHLFAKQTTLFHCITRRWQDG